MSSVAESSDIFEPFGYSDPLNGNCVSYNMQYTLIKKETPNKKIREAFRKAQTIQNNLELQKLS